VNALRSPAVVALVAALVGVAAHPGLSALRAGQTGRALVATLALLLLAALAARAVHGGLAQRLLALGAALALGGLGWDGVRGHEGRLRLQPGQASQNFVEQGPGGASLGLRPLGFQAALGQLRDGIARLSLGGQEAVVTPTQAAAFAGVRLGRPRVAFTGDALGLRLAVTDAAGERSIDLRPDEVGRHGDLEIRLEQYFPDFALDANNQPYSRSHQPGQTAALLDVRRGAESFRVFVLSSAPGVHQVEGLGASFALTGVEAAQEVELRVTQAPAALVVLAGVVLAGLALGLAALEAPPARHEAAPAIATGLMLCAALVALGGGAVLEWSFWTDRDATVLAVPAAGLALGLALVSSLGGALLVAAPVLASGPAAPALLVTLGRRGLLLGATLAVLGSVVLVLQVGLRLGTAHEAALLLLFGGAVAASVASAEPAAIPRAATAGSLLLLAVAGVASWLQAGGYDTQAVASLACVSLLAMAVSE